MGSAAIQLPKDCVETSGLISSWALELSTVPSPIPGATTSLSFLDVVSSISLKMQLEAHFSRQRDETRWVFTVNLHGAFVFHTTWSLAPSQPCLFSTSQTLLRGSHVSTQWSKHMGLLPPLFPMSISHGWFFTLYLQLTFLSPTSAVWSQVSEFGVCINTLSDFLTPGTESKNSGIATQGTYLQCRSWLVTPGNKKILAYHTNLSFLGG